MSPSTSIVFVLPTEAAGQQGPVAAWVNTAGWVMAASALGYESTVLNPSGVVDAEELRRSSRADGKAARDGVRLAAFLPTIVKTAVKDLRGLYRAMRFSRLLQTVPVEAGDVAFIWQRHELFHRGGLRLARRLGLPFVLYVVAPKVWEARQWGVKRPGWGTIVERFGEQSLFRSADLVACVSEEVGAAVQSMGVPKDRILVTPSTADTSLFDPRRESAHWPEIQAFDETFVIGWTGSFRRFHALETLVEAMPRIRSVIPEALLLLVGGGPERAGIAAMVAEHHLQECVRFVDTLDQQSLPALLATCDVTVLLSRPSQPFHYSPLKLWEYLSMGRAVVAAVDGSIARMLSEEESALVVPPGDADSLAQAIARLREDPALRRRLGKNARLLAERESWQTQLSRVVERLESRALK